MESIKVNNSEHGLVTNPTPGYIENKDDDDNAINTGDNNNNTAGDLVTHGDDFELRVINDGADDNDTTGTGGVNDITMAGDDDKTNGGDNDTINITSAAAAPLSSMIKPLGNSSYAFEVDNKLYGDLKQGKSLRRRQRGAQNISSRNALNKKDAVSQSAAGGNGDVERGNKASDASPAAVSTQILQGLPVRNNNNSLVFVIYYII